MNRILDALRRRPALALDALKYAVVIAAALGFTIEPEVSAAVGGLLLVALTVATDRVTENQKAAALTSPPPCSPGCTDCDDCL